ncbi:MAG: endo alpha-1,4 polygalactosaminidase [SAR324 cluster bacterium]|nr:endo alpha-1,4 polygalactosaminidase [SAR324 cluster bacterium]
MRIDLICGLVMGLVLISCVTVPEEASSWEPKFQSWAYQLQAADSYDIELMAESQVELIVMDYSHDGTAAKEITPSEIQQIRQGTGSESSKVILSYLSVGEAEQVRFYWQDSWITDGQPNENAPAFLAAANPKWPDNFKVRYWMPEWHSVLYGVREGIQKSYLDRIIDAGFDGIYLDIIDAFYYFGPDGEGPELESEEVTANRMVELVLKLTQYARQQRQQTNFLVVPQNGTFIIRSASPQHRADYLAAIDGLGLEDTFFFGEKEINNDLAPQQLVIDVVKDYQADEKFILAIDYLTDPDKIEKFYELAQEARYIPYVNSRELSQFTFPPGHTPGQ